MAHEDCVQRHEAGSHVPAGRSWRCSAASKFKPMPATIRPLGVCLPHHAACPSSCCLPSYADIQTPALPAKPESALSPVVHNVRPNKAAREAMPPVSPVPTCSRAGAAVRCRETAHDARLQRSQWCHLRAGL